MRFASFLLLILAFSARTSTPGPQEVDDAAARLELMKKSVGGYRLRPADGPGDAYRLRPDPVLRFTNPVGNSRDGAVFLWLGEGDRPAAAVQVQERRDGLWFHELSSLSTVPLIANSAESPDWAPSRAGIEFRAVPGAPRPAGAAEQRLRQMQELVRGFTAEDDFQRKSWQPLRVLTRPLARYGKPGSGPIDGCLFGYVLTSDPEVLLMIEAGQGPDGPEWRYAFAPMTVYPVRGSWKGKEVWNLPFRPRPASTGPAEPFHVREVRPGG
jgi:hypothetical protein